MANKKRLGSLGSELIFDHKYYSAEFWKSLTPEKRELALKIYDAHRAAIKRLNREYFGMELSHRDNRIISKKEESDQDNEVDKGEGEEDDNEDSQ